MGLVGELLPFLVGAYLLDCLVRVRRRQTLFSSVSGRSFRRAGAGWRWAGLLPTSEGYLAVPLAPAVTGCGVLIEAEHAGPERLVPWEQMEHVTVRDDRIRLRPGVELRAPHPSMTAQLATLLEELRVAPATRRPAIVRRALAGRCDLRALRRLRTEQAPDLSRLKALSGVAFLVLFGVLPASLVPELAWRPPLPVAAGLFGLAYLAVLLASVRFLRRRGVRGWAVASRMLPLVVFPPAAAHAPSLVAREAFLGFEPLAVSALLLEPQAFRALEQRRRQEWAEQGTAGARSLSLELALDLVSREAGRAGLPELARPIPVDASAASFCPRCREQYRSGFERCHECGVALESFVA